MLELTDPLWHKLDDAFRDRNIPEVILGLAKSWDQEEAQSLLWDCLCHQDTCYGATYAAVPHLLQIAAPAGSRAQRLEIALFLASVAFCAFGKQYDSAAGRAQAPIQGLPLTVEDWDKKLSYYRSLGKLLNNPMLARSTEQVEELRHCKEVLDAGPVNAQDLVKVRAIGQNFLAALPQIRELCERTLLENPKNEEAELYLLSGMAAADGVHDLASVLKYGEEGLFRCRSCDWGYEYITFGNRVAIYADDDGKRRAAGGTGGSIDKALADYKAHAPANADGFFAPIAAGTTVADPRASALLDFTKRAGSEKAVFLMQTFLGSFRCVKCGGEATLKAV